jgi:hypothetical protein
MPTDYTDYSVPQWSQGITSQLLGIGQFQQSQQREQRLQEFQARQEQVADRKAGIDALQGLTNIAKAQVSPAVKKVLLKNYLTQAAQIQGKPIDEGILDAITKATDEDRQMMLDGMGAVLGADEAMGAMKLMDVMGGNLQDAMGFIQKGLEIKRSKEEAELTQRWQESESTGIPPAPPTPRGASMLGPTQYRADVEREARAAGLDPRLVESMIRIESGGNPQAVSPAGAQGLMQLMPETGREVGMPPQQAMDPKQNIKAGVTYFKQLYDRYGGDVEKALTAYHSGPGNVDAGTLGPRGKAYAPQVLGAYRAAGGPDLSGINAKIAGIQQQLDYWSQYPGNNPGIKNRINNLEQQRTRLTQDRDRAIDLSFKAQGEQRQERQEQRQERTEQRQERESILNPEVQEIRLKEKEAEGLLASQARATPGQQVEELGSIQANLDMLNHIEGLFNPDFVGPARGRLGSLQEVTGGLSDAELDMRTAMASYQNIMTQLRSGAAVTPSEAVRLKREAPLPTDRPEVIRSKLRTAKDIWGKILARRQEALGTGGYGKIPTFESKPEAPATPPSGEAPATHRFNPSTGKIEPVR